jgi:uncharacterized tellurite resistance protein B-like protein
MLKDLLDKLAGNTETTEAPEDNNRSQVAFTALLVEAARADEDYTDAEKALINKLVQRQFDVDEATALSLREQAEAEQAEAHDMYRFSSQVKSALSHEEKIELIEAMWEVVLTDEKRDPYEDMVIRRLSGLIYVEDTEAQAARRRVEERLA